MAVLSCDVCGGSLLIDAGGKTATCQYCGAKHSIERMREKVQEIKGTVSIEGEVNVAGIANVENLLVRAREFEEEGDCAKAEEYYNRVVRLRLSSFTSFSKSNVSIGASSTERGTLFREDSLRWIPSSPACGN